MRRNKGFTLIEILVVVLIIGILGAIALPQYQRALLKSRFAALMPIAKSMADSNEAYYLEHGEYADNAEDLPVQGRRNYSDGTELEFGTTSEYSYVLATRDNDFPNKYIVYQKHSEQFPGEIHCEAATDNTQAQEVCKSFGATEDIGEILTPNYLTYVLSGTGNGVARCPQGATCNSEGIITECPSGQTLHNGECVACDIANATACSTTAYEATECVGGYSLIGGGCIDAVRYTCNQEIVGTKGSKSEATCTQVCEDTSDPDCYQWIGGKTYTGGAYCGASSSYACAGATFQSGYCEGTADNGCAGSVFGAGGSRCIERRTTSCIGAKIESGGTCWAGVKNGCRGVLFGVRSDGKGIGTCYQGADAPNSQVTSTCTAGVPLTDGKWNSSTQSYRVVGWNNGYCDPNKMISGVCPDGSPKQGGGWHGDYCEPALNGTYQKSNTCPAGSPKQGGGTW